MLPSAEKTALAIIRATGVKAYVTPPRGVTAPYVHVTRVGGRMENLVTDGALLAVSAYAGDPAVAEQLALQARNALWEARTTFVDGVWVRWWVEAAGPSHYADPESKLFRNQFSGQLMLATNK